MPWRVTRLLGTVITLHPLNVDLMIVGHRCAILQHDAAMTWLVASWVLELHFDTNECFMLTMTIIEYTVTAVLTYSAPFEIPISSRMEFSLIDGNDNRRRLGTHVFTKEV